MTFYFDMATQPFIPVLRRDGSRDECSLLDVLVNAHDLAELRDESPLTTIALHRLLLAILHHCYQGPKKATARLEIHKAQRFDSKRLKAYFEEHSGHFDLFHERYPFYQRAGFSTREPSAINRLAQERSRGNNAALFDHTTDEQPPAFTPAEAARRVIAEQAFAVGGGKSDTGYTTHAPLVSGAVVLVRGDTRDDTLFETLWLNLTEFGRSKPFPSTPEDAPVWQRPPSKPSEDAAIARGYLDYLTWQSRTLRLHPEEDAGRVVVRHVSYAQGRKFEAPAGFFDPMTAYGRRDKKEEFRPVRFNEFKDLWRDSAALFQIDDRHQDYERAPTVLHTLTAYELKQVLPRSSIRRLSVFGLCTDKANKAKVNFWRHETMPLPLAYLDRPELDEALKQAITLAEDVAHALRSAAWVAVRDRLTGDSGMTPKKERVQQVYDSFAPERPYWSRLEAPFRDLLVNFAKEGADLKALIDNWYSTVLYPTAVDAFRRSVGRIDAARDLEAYAAGERQLYIQLKKVRKTHGIPEREKEGPT